ncbi:MAG TPA: energy transducer TonB [Longimicrobiales bacterium]
MRKRSPLAVILVLGACQGPQETPQPVPQSRCMELAPVSANQIVDSVAVVDTLGDVLAGIGDADMELVIVADSMTTTVGTRRTTLPDSLARMVERVVDWNTLPRPSMPDERPLVVQVRDTAPAAPEYLEIALRGGAVTRMVAAPGSICRPRLINGPEIVSALVRSDAVRFAGGGAVTIRLFVDAEGRVFESAIVHSSGDPGIDALARGLAMSAVFEPATFRGRPVPIVTELPFELNGARRRR